MTVKSDCESMPGVQFPRHSLMFNQKLEIMRTFIINSEYSVECFYYETHKKWGHKARLLKNGIEVLKIKIRYYNRTWERFQYQTILDKILTKSKILPAEKRIDLLDSLF